MLTDIVFKHDNKELVRFTPNAEIYVKGIRLNNSRKSLEFLKSWLIVILGAETKEDPR
jgi:hypothetical protein